MDRYNTWEVGEEYKNADGTSSMKVLGEKYQEYNELIPDAPYYDLVPIKDSVRGYGEMLILEDESIFVVRYFKNQTNLPTEFASRISLS